jgi:hypothetical protein
LAALLILVGYMFLLFQLSSNRKAQLGHTEANNATNITKPEYIGQPSGSGIQATMSIQEYITEEKLKTHLDHLYSIGLAEKSRAIGTQGYNRSLEYVISQLETMSALLHWRIQNFTVVVNEQDHSEQPYL